ncbi:helix-turn-helix domain-containing protein [Citrobacter braakii]|uniref:helix-turn-helix domain-containing protein n=1 Tax=Citrobacter braakii TaxID=57706 RepID=UPI00197FFC36|nr:AraC family transcriptional regulator [Citrobacter braakii]MBN4809686.1 helix-turn-helix transcriptional regulator [Citrobacter braakii]MBN4814684.1 helix-turn-helix transcriptional regulator [Citrobacter braakii]MBN4823859.1 helix-turn-helix transcriptional regulator [Citrobacter braakii]MBN4838736.1 helix-turn-helix transcriptional regulator [Citrobacter braakii]MBN4852378.1 helix-turn-helix transcriptional regulator [Citrobacter braakii]
MLNDLSVFLLAAGMMQAALLSVFLLLPSNIIQVSNRLLVIVLLTLAAGFGELFLYGSGVSFLHSNYAYIGTLISLLQPPAIYLYTRSLMYRHFRIRPAHAVHLIPFATGLIVFFTLYVPLSDSAKITLLQQQDLPGMPVSLPLALAYHGVFLGWLGYSLRRLRSFNSDIQHLYSDIARQQMLWLRFLLSGYSGLWIVSIICCLFFYLFRLTDKTSWVLPVVSIAGFAFINTLLVCALRQPAAFMGLTQADEILLENIQPVKAPQLRGAEQVDKVAEFMHRNQPFLDSTLSLSQLAHQLKLSPHDLSAIINNGFQQNFFTFISEYRIEHAKKLLAMPEDKRTILDIMYSSGFNSKSVFNTAFKKQTGLTPSEYRRQYL